MKLGVNCIGLAILAAAVAINTAALPISGYVGRSWRAADGLPTNVVYAMTQTSDGYLWVGTQSRLARFDGVHFAAFSTQNTQQLPSNRVTALFQSANGDLYIGTSDGLALVRQGRFVAIDGALSLRHQSVSAIAGSSTAVWVGINTGLNLISKNRARKYTVADGLLNNS